MTTGATGDRPVRPALSREYVLRAALDLIDEHGVDGLTMRRLGARLGVDPMAVYHWVPNKAALLDGVVELLWSQVRFDDADATVGWQAAFLQLISQFRDQLRAHPRAVAAVGTHPANTPALFALFDRAGRMLVAAGLDAAAVVDLTSCAVTFTIGHVLAEVVDPVGGGSEQDHDQIDAATADLPGLAAVLGAWTYDPDRQWRAGLTAMLAGWA